MTNYDILLEHIIFAVYNESIFKKDKGTLGILRGVVAPLDEDLFPLDLSTLTQDVRNRIKITNKSNYTVKIVDTIEIIKCNREGEYPYFANIHYQVFC